MDMIATVKSKMSLPAFKQGALTLLIEHSPCCLLAFFAGFVGIAFLYHNPLIELGFALGGALIGKKIGQRYFHSTCCSDTDNIPFIGLTGRQVMIALLIGLLSWSAHQGLVHGTMPFTGHA
jgi:hypothetical protein